MVRLTNCLCIVILGSAALLMTAPETLADDIVKVAVARQGTWDSAPAELGKRAGFFKRYNISVTLTYFQDSAGALQDVISNNSDLGLDIDVLPALREYASGAPIRIIGSTLAGSPNYWYVLASSPIHTTKDMAKRKIAYDTNGTASHFDGFDLLKAFRIKAKLMPTGPAERTFQQLKSGAIDVAWAASPFGAEDLDQGTIRVVARANDIPKVRNRTSTVMITTVQTLQRKKDLLTLFLHAYGQTIGWMYSDPSALAQYAELAGVPQEVARRLRDTFHDKDLMLPMKGISIKEIMTNAVAEHSILKPLSLRQRSTLVQLLDSPGGVVCELPGIECSSDPVAPRAP